MVIPNMFYLIPKSVSLLLAFFLVFKTKTKHINKTKINKQRNVRWHFIARQIRIQKGLSFYFIVLIGCNQNVLWLLTVFRQRLKKDCVVNLLIFVQHIFMFRVVGIKTCNRACNTKQNSWFAKISPFRYKSCWALKIP